MQSLLGMSLLKRFEYMGNPADLDTAMDAVRRCGRSHLLTSPRASGACRIWLTPCSKISSSPGTPLTLIGQPRRSGGGRYHSAVHSKLATALSGLALVLLGGMSRPGISATSTLLSRPGEGSSAAPAGELARAGILSNLPCLRSGDSSTPAAAETWTQLSTQPGRPSPPPDDPRNHTAWSNLGLASTPDSR